MAGFIGNTITNAINSATGQTSGTNLDTFLSKFYSSEGKFIDTLDPKTTFDVTIQFFPDGTSSTDATSESQWYERLGNSLVDSAKFATRNLVNNVTGGLVGSIMNDVDIISERNKTAKTNTDISFVEYLLRSNLLTGSETWFGGMSSSSDKPSAIEFQLGPYVQTITLPNYQIQSETKSINSLGEFPILGGYVKTDTNQLTMEILNTTAALHERLFYPWMRECTLPYWVYSSQPYTTATITVDFTKHNDAKYIFCGCRPINVYSMQGNQDTSSAENIRRQVVFLFDCMFIQASLKTTETWTQKILSTGLGIANTGMKMLNM